MGGCKAAYGREVGVLSLGLDLGRLVFVVFWKALKLVVERWMIKDGLLNGWRVTESLEWSVG